jgi:hypothetical protein
MPPIGVDDAEERPLLVRLSAMGGPAVPALPERRSGGAGVANGPESTCQAAGGYSRRQIVAAQGFTALCEPASPLLANGWFDH